MDTARDLRHLPSVAILKVDLLWFTLCQAIQLCSCIPRIPRVSLEESANLLPSWIYSNTKIQDIKEKVRCNQHLIFFHSAALLLQSRTICHTNFAPQTLKALLSMQMSQEDEGSREANRPEEDQGEDVVLVANVIEASKDGDVVKYTIQSKEVCAPSSFAFSKIPC